MDDDRKPVDVFHHLIANPIVPAGLAIETFIAFINGGAWEQMALGAVIASVIWSVSDRTV